MPDGRSAAPALPPPPWIIGHRGAAGEALENTLESLALAVAQGADMVEMDLQLSGDGELVLFHDWELGRLAGRAGVVEELTAVELGTVELRVTIGGAPRRGRIATAAEGLDSLPPELPINLELKRRRAPRARFAEALAGLLEGRPQALVSSFDWELLAAVRARLPRQPLAPLGRRGRRELLAVGERLGAWSLHCHRRMAGRLLTRAARRAGRPVLSFTVNRPRLARRLLRRGVAGLFTDHPGRLRAALEAR